MSPVKEDPGAQSRVHTRISNWPYSLIATSGFDCGNTPRVRFYESQDKRMRWSYANSPFSLLCLSLNYRRPASGKKL